MRNALIVASRVALANARMLNEQKMIGCGRDSHPSHITTKLVAASREAFTSCAIVIPCADSEMVPPTYYQVRAFFLELCKQSHFHIFFFGFIFVGWYTDDPVNLSRSRALNVDWNCNTFLCSIFFVIFFNVKVFDDFCLFYEVLVYDSGRLFCYKQYRILYLIVNFSHSLDFEIFGIAFRINNKSHLTCASLAHFNVHRTTAKFVLVSIRHKYRAYMTAYMRSPCRLFYYNNIQKRGGTFTVPSPLPYLYTRSLITTSIAA